MLTVIGSVKGSPGATTSGLALSAAWPRPGAVLLEADPAGGDLSVRLSSAHADAPNIASVAAFGRGDDLDLDALAMGLNERVRVVPGLVTNQQRRGISELWTSLCEALIRARRDVIVDVGRLERHGPLASLLDAADAEVVVLRAEVAQLVHVREHVRGSAVGRVRHPLIPLVVGLERHRNLDCAEVDEVLTGEQLGVEVTQHLAWDPVAVESLQNGDAPDGRLLARSRLMRSAHRTVEVLARATQVDAGQPS